MNNNLHESTSTTRARPLTTMVVALALTGFGLRAGVTSVGAALDSIQREFGADGFAMGLLTTLPVLCFAALGLVAPSFARRFGVHRTLVSALAISSVGFVARAFAPSLATLLLLSVVTLSGAAVANVLLPSLVKLHFPKRIGAMTAVYATALSVGTAVSAGLTIPIAEATSSWRMGIGVWAIVPAIAIIPWISAAVHETRKTRLAAAPAATIRPRDLLRSATAWWLALFFGSLSAIAYIGFGWLAHYLIDFGTSEAGAGAMLAILTGMSIPVAMVIPALPQSKHRLIIVVLSISLVVAFLGLAFAPGTAPWLWMALYGLGTGMFPLSLAMIGLRTRNHETTAATSAFVQSVGYLIAGTGPLLFGVLYGLTGGWTASFAVLWGALVVAVVTGIKAARPRYIDDETTAGRRPESARSDV